MEIKSDQEEIFFMSKITACLHVCGNDPEEKEEMMRCKKGGELLHQCPEYMKGDGIWCINQSNCESDQ